MKEDSKVLIPKPWVDKLFNLRQRWIAASSRQEEDLTIRQMMGYIDSLEKLLQ